MQRSSKRPRPPAVGSSRKSPARRRSGPPLWALAVACALISLTATPEAWASTTPTAPPTGSLAAQAAELTNQIQAQSVAIDKLSEQVDAAQINQQKIAAQIAASQTQSAATEASLATARQVLAQQAIAAYIAGDGSETVSVPGKAGNDFILVAGYADAVVQIQDEALNNFDALSTQESQEQAQLAAEQQSAGASLAQLESSERAAQAASQAEQATLAQVNGQLAVMVAADQQAAEQSQAAQAAQQDQGAPAPTGTPPTSSASPPVATPANLTPSTPASTTAPPTTAAPTTAPPTTAPPTTPPTTKATTPPSTAPPATAAPAPPAPSNGLDAQAPGVAAALAYARAQIGKPYQWAGSGPGSFDCSGLVMMAWATGGVSFPHLAQSQYDMTQRESVDQAVPGDLIFFGTPDDVYHVGIYVGGDQMIDAPSTGETISVRTIYIGDLLGAGRVHT